jgi:hypothetical protein
MELDLMNAAILLLLVVWFVMDRFGIYFRKQR